MADIKSPETEETVASHTLAYLRSHGKKLDLILDMLSRHGERLSRLERDVLETKSDIVLMENKVLSAQTEILVTLHRLDELVSAPSA